MKVKSVSFTNYKAFFEEQTIKLKPITILIGKNSSGKSAIAKLFILLEKSLMGDTEQPLLLQYNGIEIAEDFDSLFFGKSTAGLTLDFQILFENNVSLTIKLLANQHYGLSIEEWSYQDSQKEFKLKFDYQEKCYYDTITKTFYECQFKGFIPVVFSKKYTNEDLLRELQFIKIDVDYIGPFRILPKRYFSLTGEREFRDTGVTGENAYQMLGVSKSQRNGILHQKVGQWYKDNFDGWEVIVEDRKKKPLIEILLSKNLSDVDTLEINIVDVGQGINQSLPLVVRANVKDRPDSIVVIEQPELHLHPVAHGNLAELFARSAKENHQTFIIETHSENVILRLRKLIVDNNFGFTKDDLIIYWIEDAEFKGKELREITVDEEGVLSDWPEEEDILIVNPDDYLIEKN